MNGHQNRFGPFMGKELAAIAHHSHFTAHYRSSGGGSHSYDQLRVYSRYFCLKPRPARGYFCRARFGVDAPLASWRKLEMFHGVRDVEFGTIDTCGLQRAIQQLPRRADEWPALLIFFVTRLLADQNHSRLPAPFSKYCLRRILIQAASFAVFRSFAKPIQVLRLRHPWRC